VLCEKPFTANAEEAASVADAARHSGLVVMEAFHDRYHALTAQMLQILNSGELGTITKMEAWLCFPLVPPNNVRWDYQLASGALMDAGCYTIPQLVHRLVVRSDTRRAVEHVPRQPSTYASQLRVFTGAVLRGEPVLTGPDDAVANMTVIDACYAAARLPRREPSR
jgi:predicted dehydrogenase